MTRRWLSALLLVALGMCVAPTRDAAAVPLAESEIGLGDIRSPDRSPEVERSLRQALVEELRTIAPKQNAKRRRFILSATVVELSSEKRAQHVRASAAISLALQRAEDSTLFAELRGKASAEEAGEAAAVRALALRAAVRSAVSRLPQATRAAQ